MNDSTLSIEFSPSEKTENKPLNFSISTEPIPFDQVLDSALTYFKGDELAANVWISKYALKNSEGQLFEKSPDDMHHRIAVEVSRIEKNIQNH